MTTVLQVGDRTITTEELMPLLTSYQLVPRLLFELIVDQAIAPFSCTSEEAENAYQQFCQKNQLVSNREIKVWLENNAMTSEQLQTYVVRKLKIEKFKQATWGQQLESYFFSRKPQLDKVLYSIIQTSDIAAQELYFRIQEKEAEFAELARRYSQADSAANGGLVGPVELGNCPPALAKILRISQPGQLWQPTRIGEWLIILRLEKFISAQLDNLMRERLLSELFANWLQQQFNQPDLIKILPSKDNNPI
jgi:parvulin-like peptidyl-prolyl isomerase